VLPPRHILAAGLVLLAAGCSRCSDPFYELTTAEPVVRLPADEAPHCFGGVEWWYYSGRLMAEAGRDFGVEVVVFHVPPVPLCLGGERWAAQFAVIDVQGARFKYAQIELPGPQPSAAAPGGGFDLHTPLVDMRGGNGLDLVQALFPDGSYAVSLELLDRRGPVLHDGDGYVPFGTNGQAFYYSRPRMDASGTLSVGNEMLAVTGQIWFDRQWGRDLNNPRQRWQWFSLRMHDGSDIMLYEFPGVGGAVAFGTFVPPSGPAFSLSAEDFKIVPTRTWFSAATGVEYAVGWTIELPGNEAILTVTAVVDDAELDTRATTGEVYWEGLCTISGSMGAEVVDGYAYIEQVNGP
jgi:predicted secreted hydrolase